MTVLKFLALSLLLLTSPALAQRQPEPPKATEPAKDQPRSAGHPSMGPPVVAATATTPVKFGLNGHDGRTYYPLAEIEKEVFGRHPMLFRSPAEAATFVAEVVTRYSE